MTNLKRNEEKFLAKKELVERFLLLVDESERFHQLLLNAVGEFLISPPKKMRRKK